MPPRILLVDAVEVEHLRERYRQEMNCQIVHDSIHRRPGWTRTYLMQSDGETAGFGLVACGGPWSEQATLLEFYLEPSRRSSPFEFFEALVHESEASRFEIQSNDALPLLMTMTYGRRIESERIVFRDARTTQWTVPGATLQATVPDAEVRDAIERRQGGGEWRLEVGGAKVASGGILFHYNRPYGDVHMEVAVTQRRRGYGGFIVQELKRIAYELGAIPAARCSPRNEASRRTLMKAGFEPYAHMLIGDLEVGVLAPDA
jgi:RimJ/RimL family protein N-acetyltransferase